MRTIIPHAHANTPLKSSAARVRVPSDLRTLTCIDDEAECRPESVGLSNRARARIWSAVESWYRSGLQPAITMVLRRHGQVLIKRSLGAVHGNLVGENGPLVPLHPDTPMCLWSSSKAISSLLVHKLVDGGKLNLDDPVVCTVPEFGAHGKHQVTLRHLLTHRAGIPRLPLNLAEGIPTRWDEAVARICDAPLQHANLKTKAYHAITAGFVLGEVVRRISALAPDQALRRWLTDPLGCHTMRYGVDPAQRAQVPRSIRTGALPRLLALVPERGVGMPIDTVIGLSDSDAFQSAVIPAANLYASADDVSRVYQMLLDGGRWGQQQLFKPQTIAAMCKPAGSGLSIDRTLGIPMKYSAGFMLGADPIGLYGKDSGSAFGHLGFLTVISWADPARGISVALLSNGKSVMPPALLGWGRVMAAISTAIPRD